MRGEVRWLKAKSVLGAPSQWFSSLGGTGPRVRYTDDGRIEVEGQGLVKDGLPPDVNNWANLIWKYATLYGVPPHFLAGIMGLESQGNPKASSGKAFGIMQFTTATASRMAGRTVTSEELLNNPELGIELGAKYVREQTDRYQGNPIHVSASYNAGSAVKGSSCVTKDASGACTERCPPNQWNLRTDCYKRKDGTRFSVDYPLIVFKYANAAWEGAFNPSRSTPSCPQGFEADAQGVCKPVKPINTVNVASASDSSSLFLVLGAVALTYLVFFQGKKALR